MVFADSLTIAGGGGSGQSGSLCPTMLEEISSISTQETKNIETCQVQIIERKQKAPPNKVINSISFDCEPYCPIKEQQEALDKKQKREQEKQEIVNCLELELIEKQKQHQQWNIKTTKKRYLILSMFVTLHMIKSFQWICLASITNVVAQFYRVDNLAINWTTILFMVTFLILALPVSWLMEKIGLRRAVLIGTFGVTCGVIIKCFSCHQDAFLYCMLGHLIVGLAEPFFFSSYSQVASVWFPDDQVAMATAWSVIGGQMGLALGFIIPPLMIGSDPDDELAIQQGLFKLFLAVAIISTLNTISILIFFEERPQFAPGVARFKQIIQEEKRRRSSQAIVGEQVQKKLALAAAATATANNCVERNSSSSNKEDDNGNCRRQMATMTRRRESRGDAFVMRAREVGQSVGQQIEMSRDILFNRHFILLLIGFGINVGTVYSIHTLLNQMITRALPPPTTTNNVNQVLQVNANDQLMIFDSNNNNTVAAAAPFGNNHISDLATLDIDHTNNNNGQQSLNLNPIPFKPTQQLVATQQQQHQVAQKWVGDDTNLVVGNTGLISILAGLLGSALCGYALDRFHRYKLTMSTIYLLTLISMIALTACVRLANPLAFYLVAIPLGFAFTGYEGCGFDYGVEITYPNPELLSSTLLNISAQICGVPISLIGSIIVDNYGSEALGLFFCASLTVGFLMNCLQGGQLKRQDAVRERTATAAISNAVLPQSTTMDLKS